MPEVPWPMLRPFVESVKVGTETVKTRVVDAVWLPEVPLMVRLYCPAAAELLAVSVRVLLYPVVGFGKKDAVTPLGSPNAESVTLPENPFRGFTLTKDVPEVPWPRLRLPAESVNDGVPMARAKAVVTVTAPDLPVMVTLYCPTATELLAVSVRVLLYPAIVGFDEKDAVTPLGRPEAERVTPPVNPFRGFTLT